MYNLLTNILDDDDDADKEIIRVVEKWLMSVSPAEMEESITSAPINSKSTISNFWINP